MTDKWGHVRSYIVRSTRVESVSTSQMSTSSRTEGGRGSFFWVHSIKKNSISKKGSSKIKTVLLL